MPAPNDEHLKQRIMPWQIALTLAGKSLLLLTPFVLVYAALLGYAILRLNRLSTAARPPAPLPSPTLTSQAALLPVIQATTQPAEVGVQLSGRTTTATTERVVAEADSPTLNPTVTAPALRLSPDSTQSATAEPSGATPTLAVVSSTAFVEETPIVAATTLSSDWSFEGMRLSSDPTNGGVWLYGNMINNTGIGQALVSLGSRFFDAQGNPVDDDHSEAAAWLIPVVPPGGRMPFLLYVADLQSPASFVLDMTAEPSNEVPRHDFAASDLTQTMDEGQYCVWGKLHNPGPELQTNLFIVLVLYDRQDRVVNFGDDPSPGFGGWMGDQVLDFQICLDPLQQTIARYEVQAWGQ